MAQGFSFECFAADVGVGQEVIHHWAKAFPDFNKAKSAGTALCQRFWENIGICGATGQLPGFNAAAFIFNMKNRFKWSDRADLKITGDFQERNEDHDLLQAVDRSKLVEMVRKA